MPLHGLVCTAGVPRGIATTRHQSIKSDLAECIRQCLSTATNLKFQIIPEASYSLPDHNINVDLTVLLHPGESNEKRWLIDVSVREPCSRHGLQPYPFRHKSASRSGEEEKQRYLQPLAGRFPDCSIKPFVIESNGAIGPDTMQLLNLLSSIGSSTIVRNFLRLTSHRLAFFTSKITHGAANIDRN